MLSMGADFLNITGRSNKFQIFRGNVLLPINIVARVGEVILIIVNVSI